LIYVTLGDSCGLDPGLDDRPFVLLVQHISLKQGWRLLLLLVNMNGPFRSPFQRAFSTYQLKSFHLNCLLPLDLSHHATTH
jgi:hypothetical protein